MVENTFIYHSGGLFDGIRVYKTRCLYAYYIINYAYIKRAR